MIITLLEKQVSIKMTEQEAMVLRKFLGLTPINKPEHGEAITIDCTRIGDKEYPVLYEIYRAIAGHGI